MCIRDRGKIKKVAANTYIITPYSVDIMGDLIDELENNGQMCIRDRRCPATPT